MKMYQKRLCVLLCTLFLLMPGRMACAASLPERVAALEAELGMSAEGSIGERITALENMLGIEPAPGTASVDRIAALEKDLGLTENPAGKNERGGPEDSVLLSSLEPFTCSYVFTDFSTRQYKDMYGGQHPSTLFSEASLGFGDNEVEYLLDGAYREMRGVLYIPKGLSSLVEDVDVLRAKVKIYGDDRLLYISPAMQRKDEPSPLRVDLTGVRFLKIVFEDAQDIGGPYIVIGDAELIR